MVLINKVAQALAALRCECPLDANLIFDGMPICIQMMVASDYAAPLILLQWKFLSISKKKVWRFFIFEVKYF
jgi:hypothetical protein